MGHAADPDTQSASGALELDDATHIAQTMGVLSTPSRGRLLACLRDGPASVTELARIADMQQSAASHQLRVLCHLRLVTTHRHGKHIIYTLHDIHIAALLDEAIGQHEHRKLTQPHSKQQPDHDRARLETRPGAAAAT